MDKKPLLAIGACAVLIIGGFALVTVAPTLGTVVVVVGIAILLLYLAAVFLAAWRGDQKRAWGPGSLRREYREEQAAKRK